MINFTSISAIFCDGKNKNLYSRATHILQILLPDQEKNRNCNLSLIFCDKEVKHIFFLILSCGDLKKINITAFLAQNLKSAFLEEI